MPFQAVAYSVSPSTTGAPVRGELVMSSQRTPRRPASAVVIAARAGAASRASATARCLMAASDTNRRSRPSMPSAFVHGRAMPRPMSLRLTPLLALVAAAPLAAAPRIATDGADFLQPGTQPSPALVF